MTIIFTSTQAKLNHDRDKLKKKHNYYIIRIGTESEKMLET